MTRLSSTLFVFLFFTTVACVGGTSEQVEGTGDAQSGEVPFLIIAGLPTEGTPDSEPDRGDEARLEVIESTDFDLHMIRDHSDVCLCTSQECQRAWVKETFGCGLCVVFVGCGEGASHGACVVCD